MSCVIAVGALGLRVVHQVVAGAEGAAGAGQHDDMHGLVGIGALDGRRELARQVVVDGVEDLGAVERDARDAPVALVEHLGHGSRSHRSMRTRRSLSARTRRARPNSLGARTATLGGLDVLAPSACGLAARALPSASGRPERYRRRTSCRASSSARARTDSRRRVWKKSAYTPYMSCRSCSGQLLRHGEVFLQPPIEEGDPVLIHGGDVVVDLAVHLRQRGQRRPVQLHQGVDPNGSIMGGKPGSARPLLVFSGMHSILRCWGPHATLVTRSPRAHAFQITIG